MEFKKFAVIPAVITMFDESERVDEKAQRQTVRFLLERGVDGFYAGGATGEGFFMQPDERKRVIDITVEEAAGKVPVIAYTGSNDTKTAVELSQFAEKAGADMVSSVPPYFGAFSFDMVKNYYSDIAASVKIPLLMYTNMLTRVMSESEIKEICYLNNCAGMKYTQHNHYMMKVLKMSMPDRFVFSGVDEMCGSAILSGVDGAIGTTYNFAPELFMDLRDAFAAGDLKEFYRLSEASVAMVDAFVKNGFLPSLKAIYSLCNIGKGYCRRPNLTYDKNALKVTAELLKLKQKYSLNNIEMLNRLGG